MHLQSKMEAGEFVLLAEMEPPEGFDLDTLLMILGLPPPTTRVRCGFV